MLRVHFLNVGHGDCTIIEHASGRLTMVDINNSQQFDSETRSELLAEDAQSQGVSSAFGSYADSPPSVFSTFYEQAHRAKAFELIEAKAKRELTDPVEYMRRVFPKRRLFRFVLTHPDLDHMRGLKRLHKEVGFANFWDTRHQKTASNLRGGADREDWYFYEQLRAEGRCKYYVRGDSHFAFAEEAKGYQGGDGVEILSPTPQLMGLCNTAGKSNDVSMVLRVHHAGRTILLPGDAEEMAWDDMVETFGERLKSDFLKASHHGRNSGYHRKAISLISPSTAVVSVGRKPTTDASSKYRYYCGMVASTRYYRNLILTINDNGTTNFTAEHNGAER